MFPCVCSALFQSRLCSVRLLDSAKRKRREQQPTFVSFVASYEDKMPTSTIPFSSQPEHRAPAKYFRTRVLGFAIGTKSFRSMPHVYFGKGEMHVCNESIGAHLQSTHIL